MLMSDGLYKSLEEASGSGQVNQELALLAVEQVTHAMFFSHYSCRSYPLLLKMHGTHELENTT